MPSPTRKSDATAPLQEAPAILYRPAPADSILRVDGPDSISIRAHTKIGLADGGIFEPSDDVEVEMPDETIQSGSDFHVMLDEGKPVAIRSIGAPGPNCIGGFHVAPGGNAPWSGPRQGGDDIPAINPLSCWDAGFRPACPDPRGMTLVTLPDGSRFWADIYLLGTDHEKEGTSRFGMTIADGSSLRGGLNYHRAVEIYAAHGKQLLTFDEFRVAAHGVTEKSAAPRHPKQTGLDKARTSRFGLMQATGNLWQWGTDGDPDDPRPSVFGGSWLDGSDAGSRFASLVIWPEVSVEYISARGRCDHLQPE